MDQIGKRSSQESVPRWPRPLPQAVVQVAGPGLGLALERGEQTEHRSDAPGDKRDGGGAAKLADLV